MTNALTIFPFEPFNLIEGYNSIDIQNLSLFWKIVNAFREENRDVLVLSEDNRILDISKNLLFIGDLTSCPDPKQLFYKQMIKKIENIVSDDSKQEIYNLDRQIRNIISKEIFNFALPLKVSVEWSFNDIIKMMNLSYIFHQNAKPEDLVSEFIDLKFQLTDHRILLFTNLNSYLPKSMLKKIVDESNSKNVTVISVNLLTERKAQSEAGENGFFIDSDFTMFTYQ